MQLLRRITPLLFTSLLFIAVTHPLAAQSTDNSGSLYMIAMLIIIGGLLLIGVVAMLSNSFIHYESKKAGVDVSEGGIKSLFTGSSPSYTSGAPVKKLSKGHNILLKGEATQVGKNTAKRYAVSPTDFRGMSPIPKVVVAVGDQVKAGDVIFFDKKNDKVKYAAPVSGEIVEIRRGAKRAITDVIILADSEMSYAQHEPPSISEASREDIVDYLCETGGWTLLNQRPYDVLPAVDSVPANIFVSTFDTAPLAPDANVVIAGREEAFQKGIDTLARLTEGKVHLGLNGGSATAPSAAFTSATNCEKHWFAGKHPAGNVGVQIHHAAPIAKGQKVWTLTVQDVCTLGDLMFKGQYNAARTVAVTGAQVVSPAIVHTYAGASIDELLAGNLAEGKNRIIDGDVLSGHKVTEDDFLNAKSDQITVIREGDEYEMFGWLLPIKPRPTISKTFPNFLYPNLKFDGETNTHGEKRAFVMTGQYESVLPMDMYPQHLMKAILANDYERMEGLGIQELSEEDLALCEFVCTSKQPLQKILREGLDMMRDQE